MIEIFAAFLTLSAREQNKINVDELGNRGHFRNTLVEVLLTLDPELNGYFDEVFAGKRSDQKAAARFQKDRDWLKKKYEKQK